MTINVNFTASGDNVGQEDTLELHDTVLECQFALLEPLNEGSIGKAGPREGLDGSVEIGMLLALGGKLQRQANFLFLIEWQHRQVPRSRQFLTHR